MSNAAERRDYTQKVLREKGHVSVSDLSEELGVSEVTIRKDLRYLEEHNLLLRTHGGAILPDRFVADRPFEEKAKRNAEAKRRIGKAAADLVQNNDTLFLDAGTTTMQVARHFDPTYSLTVVTNAVNIAMELLGRANTEVLMLGGMLRNTSASVVGPFAEEMIRQHACSKLFLGVDGFDIDHGLTTTNPLEAQVNRLMIDAAEQTIVVTDASKFGRRGLSRICSADQIDLIITEEGVPDDVQATLNERGIAFEMV